MPSLKHKFTSGKADGTDVTLIKPSNWNDEHNLTTLAGNVVLGRNNAVAGDVQEITITTLIGLILPPGLILPYGGATAPTAWLLCQGQSLLRADYPPLFAVLGTTWNPSADGTHFNLPDLRGRVLVGPDGGTNRLPGWTTPGVAGGAASNTVNIGVSGSVTVSTGVFNLGLNGTITGANLGGVSTAGGSVAAQLNDPVSVNGNVNFNSSGNNSMSGNNAISTVQPGITINYIIKT